jgi:hypothetical protein
MQSTFISFCNSFRLATDVRIQYGVNLVHYTVVGEDMIPTKNLGIVEIYCVVTAISRDGDGTTFKSVMNKAFAPKLVRRKYTTQEVVEK